MFLEHTLPKLYGITGHPLGHSLSPVLQSWNFSQIGHAGVYCVWPQTVEQLSSFVMAVRSLPLHGVSVTIPHKQTIIPLLDTITATARNAGAVNTLYWEDTALVGHNTDVAGFLAPLLLAPTQVGEKRFHSVLILGAGGAARAVASALAAHAQELIICARDLQKAESLAQVVGAKALAWKKRTEYRVELVVNTTPLGMQGVFAGQSPLKTDDFLHLALAGVQNIAYDLVYSPLQTPFLEAAAAAGWQTQNGLAMLAAQGVEQCRLWAGDAPAWEDAYIMLHNFINRLPVSR